MPLIGGYHPYGLASILTRLESNRACVGYAARQPLPPVYQNFGGHCACNTRIQKDLTIVYTDQLTRMTSELNLSCSNYHTPPTKGHEPPQMQRASARLTYWIFLGSKNFRIFLDRSQHTLKKIANMSKTEQHFLQISISSSEEKRAKKLS
ncbi:hypothetical protein TNCV_1863461 [Trichonephila clavipes]|nr:hypothetical protein TNCV_1863461 [Trichonephila clavipes]